jgi:hypothetical protein
VAPLPKRAAALILLASALGGCGSSSGDKPSSGEVPAEVPRTDRRPPLPLGWSRVVNSGAGYNFALPPGWSRRTAGTSTRLVSADHALAGLVTADRSDQGLSFIPKRYVRFTARSLTGFRGLRAAKPRRLVDVQYPAASVNAGGTVRKTGVRQAIVIFALKPRRGGTYSIVFFRSAAVPAARYAALLDELVRSFRVQAPVE